MGVACGLVTAFDWFSFPYQKCIIISVTKACGTNILQFFVHCYQQLTFLLLNLVQFQFLNLSLFFPFSVSIQEGDAAVVKGDDRACQGA